MLFALISNEEIVYSFSPYGIKIVNLQNKIYIDIMCDPIVVSCMTILPD
jgi:hypothetical protein